MNKKPNGLIDLLESYQNNNINDNQPHSHHHHNDDELINNHGHNDSSEVIHHPRIEEKYQPPQVEIKTMEMVDISVKRCDYVKYNGYIYRREILHDDTITWEIQRISDSELQLAIFYKIHHDRQIKILEEKFHQLNK